MKNRAEPHARPGDDRRTRPQPRRWPLRRLYCRASNAESRRTAGRERGNRRDRCRSRGESDELVRSASLSARARQLTPQAIEREGTWFAAQVGARPGRRASVFTVAAAALLATPSGEPRRRCHRRRPHRGRRPAAAAEPDRRPRRGSSQRRHADPVSAEATPRKSFFYGIRYPSLRFEFASTQPQNDLRDRRRRRKPAKSSAASSATTSPRTRTVGIRWDGMTGESARPATATTASGSAPRAPRASLARAATSTRTAQPRLRLLRLRVPDPRRPRLRRAPGPLRRRPLRPHPPGPGRDGRLRHAAGRRPRRHGPVLRLPGRRRQLRRDRRQGHALRHHLHAPRRTLAAADRRHRSAPASRSAIVGDTGDATACHLHFEIWTAPGWYEGGSPIDPLPYLKSGTPTAELRAAAPRGAAPRARASATGTVAGNVSTAKKSRSKSRAPRIGDRATAAWSWRRRRRGEQAADQGGDEEVAEAHLRRSRSGRPAGAAGRPRGGGAEDRVRPLQQVGGDEIRCRSPPSRRSPSRSQRPARPRPAASRGRRRRGPRARSPPPRRRGSPARPRRARTAAATASGASAGRAPRTSAAQRKRRQRRHGDQRQVG